MTSNLPQPPITLGMGCMLTLYRFLGLATTQAHMRVVRQALRHPVRDEQHSCLPPQEVDRFTDVLG